MRNFFVSIYKNLLWVYVCGVFFLGYQMFMESIPSHIYVRRGEAVSLTCGLPVGLAVRLPGDRATLQEMEEDSVGMQDAAQQARPLTGGDAGLAETTIGGGDAGEMETNLAGGDAGLAETTIGGGNAGEMETTLAGGDAGVAETTFAAVKARNAFVRQGERVYEDTTMTCYLFGLFPVKEIAVSVVEDQTVYASGRLIGIYEQTSGVLVLKTTALRNTQGVEESPVEDKVMSGDYITRFNRTPIHSKEELVEQIAENGTKPVTLTLLRRGKEHQVTVTPLESSEHRFFLGIWVKDDMAGIGTLSYYRPDGSFGALGHGIGDGETGELLSVDDGRIYTMTLTGITKGAAGAPGALEGMIFYGRDSCLGEVHSNSDIGIYGRLDDEDLDAFEETDQSFPIAYKQEIVPGQAWILSEVSGELAAYEIEISDLSYEPSDLNKGIRFEVKDERLLELTGGIVQGMSGSPIIQDGRLIGAVTHVLVGSPERGYGVFIETMLEED